MTNVVLAVNSLLLALVGGVLIYMLAHRGRPTAADAAMAAVQTVKKEQAAGLAPTVGDGQGRDANQPAPDPVAAAMAAPSWDAAETAFREKDYDKALDRYSRLMLASRRIPSEALVGEFFRFRIAQCMWQLGRMAEVRRILGDLQQSRSPILRAVSNADMARLAEAGEKHLQARTLAYRAIGALKAIEKPLPLEADCDHLIGRALTVKVNSIHSSDRIIPWLPLRMADVFEGRGEPQVRQLLEADTTPQGGPNEASAVRIEKDGLFWTVHARKAAVEDLLNQFTTKAGKDLQWTAVAPAVRRRVVSFTFRGLSEQRVCEVACGMVGLVARFTWDQVVVHDPDAARKLSDRRELLTGEALAVWRRFSLRFAEHERVPEGLFALGALYEWSGDEEAALKQYQILGRQYQRELTLAPKALLRSAKLWMSLRNYAGARQDLVDLLDLYQQYPHSDEVYLSLGRVNMEAGNYEEAIRIFLKVHSLNASQETRLAASLDAAECHYRNGEPKEASKWLGRFILSTKATSGPDLVRAYLLLGRSESAQGHHSAAAAAFGRALAAKPLRKRYVEAILATAEVRVAMQDYVGAMAALRRVEDEELTDAERYSHLMLASKLLRSAGLPDRARAYLRKRASALSDAQLQALLGVEQARCLRESGDLS
ncbi:MAG: tetratricopeptide repeat protein, partial [Planctomycetota bacterium]